MKKPPQSAENCEMTLTTNRLGASRFYSQHLAMRFRTLGKTGFRVSVIGIGTWQFGGEWGRDFTQAEVDAILDAAAECGINLIDTAECYGPDHLSEKLVGDYLSRRDRSKWIVATKFGHRFKGFMDRDDDYSLAGIQEQLDDSLKALRVETIDLYQFHSGADNFFQDEKLWQFLAGQKRAGKIRHLGISIMQKGSELQAREAANVGAEALQVVYNGLDRRPEQIYFPHAEENNLGILARVPLASGLLSGKYKPGATFATNDVRSTFDAEKMKKDLAEVERLQREEVPSGVPMAKWAMAWCLRNPIVTALIPGCKNPEQVRANASAADLVVK
jgi:aryl-alcohol dehydrogenase-like predicted oxidoreductase